MAKKRGSWPLQETSQKYHNSWINVLEDQVLQSNGQPGKEATATIKPGVAVLPMDSNGAMDLTQL